MKHLVLVVVALFCFCGVVSVAKSEALTSTRSSLLQHSATNGRHAPSSALHRFAESLAQSSRTKNKPARKTARLIYAANKVSQDCVQFLSHEKVIKALEAKTPNRRQPYAALVDLINQLFTGKQGTKGNVQRTSLIGEIKEWRTKTLAKLNGMYKALTPAQRDERNAIAGSLPVVFSSYSEYLPIFPDIPRVSITDVDVARDLGSGNFGAVKKAKWVTDVLGQKDQKLAIKSFAQLKSQQGALAGDLTKVVIPFLREAAIHWKVTQSLKNNPNARVAKLLAIVESDDSFSLAFEYVKGSGLDTALMWNAAGQKKNPLNTADRMRVANQVLDALEAIHAAGVFHMDLYARNIMAIKRPKPIAAGEGRYDIKVLDFGISRIKPTDSRMLFYVAPVATLSYEPSYWALPAGKGVRRVAITDKTESLEFGYLLWELWSGTITGKAGGPFTHSQRASPMSIRQDIADGKLKFPPSHDPAATNWDFAINPKVPVPIAKIIQSCLDLTPSKRPSIADLRAALKAAESQLPPPPAAATAAPTAAPPTAGPTPTAPPPRRPAPAISPYAEVTLSPANDPSADNQDGDDFPEDNFVDQSMGIRQQAAAQGLGDTVAAAAGDQIPALNAYWSDAQIDGALDGDNNTDDADTPEDQKEAEAFLGAAKVADNYFT